MFDYFYTQYLFSAATILAISSLLDPNEHKSDGDQLKLVIGLLEQLRNIGNYAAAEFYQHCEAMVRLMGNPDFCRDTNSSTLDLTSNTNYVENVSQQASVSENMTTEAALYQPLLLELLEQPLPDLEFIDASMYVHDFQELYCSPPMPAEV